MPDIFALLKTLGNEDITRYSDSEVLTPQNIVSDMVDLLPQEVFNPHSTFLDPAVKSGRFLKEIYNRLFSSPSLKAAFPDEQLRRDHILHNQLYGLATSSLSATLSRAMLYDTAVYRGNIVSVDSYGLKRSNNKVSDIKKIIEGAFNIMQFDVVIGNPPYNRGADLDFVNFGYEISTKYCVMITPAKWQTAEANQRVASQMSYGQFRQKIVPHISHVVFYPCCKDIFDIYQPDGITFYIVDKLVHNTCIVENRCRDIKWFNSTQQRTLGANDTLLNIGNDIVNSIGNYKRFYFPVLKGLHKYEVWTNTQPSGYDWYATDRPRYLLCPSRVIAVCNGERCDVVASKRIFESYTSKESESFVSWLNTRFTRFFLMPNISRLTGILTDHCFRFVPAPPPDKNGVAYGSPDYQGWDHIYTDQELYTYYNLPQKYIDVIEAVIKERT